MGKEIVLYLLITLPALSILVFIDNLFLRNRVKSLRLRFEDSRGAYDVMAKRLDVAVSERDELLRQKNRLTRIDQGQQDDQEKHKRHSAADIRKAMDRENARFLASLEEKPNSERFGHKQDEVKHG